MNKVKRYLYRLATDSRKGFFAAGITILLLGISFVYGLVIRCLISFKLRRRYRASCKIISIGNIVMGGTGKTALVEYICHFLEQHHHPYAIVSRGYKRPRFKKGIVPVAPYAALGDELYMLSLSFAHAVVIADKNRVRAIRKAVEEHNVGTVVLDDGFQQWHIQKDLEIVTINANNPFGNSRIIPRGILREPLHSLARADIFVLTKVNGQSDNHSLKEQLRKLNPSALIVESQYQPIGLYRITEKPAMSDVSLLKGKKVALLCGIADPGSFEESIRKIGAEVVLSFAFDDHYCYKKEDIAELIKASHAHGSDTIITTEKDSVRLMHLMPEFDDSDVTVLILKMHTVITHNEKEFSDRLRALYSY